MSQATNLSLPDLVLANYASTRSGSGDTVNQPKGLTT